MPRPSTFSAVFVDGSLFLNLPSTFSADFVDGSWGLYLSSTFLAVFMDGSWGLMCAIHDSGGFRGREDYQEAKMSVSAGGGMNDTEDGGLE